MAPANLSDRDPMNETPQGFCLCDSSNWCGRKAVADTTADRTEPQWNIMLGVPRTPTSRRRIRRQTFEPKHEDISTGNRRTYYTDYEYESMMMMLWYDINTCNTNTNANTNNISGSNSRQCLGWTLCRSLQRQWTDSAWSVHTYRTLSSKSLLQRTPGTAFSNPHPQLTTLGLFLSVTCCV